MIASQNIQVDNFTIGGKKTFIIAEIGSNHNQSLQLAFDSILAAKECGADAVKFQSINVDELYLNPSKATIELHKKIDLEESWHKLLKDFSDKNGITFFSSPTYLNSIEILENLNVSLYKLASAQIGTFPQLVKKVAATGKPVILSTGIVNYKELRDVIRIFDEVKNPNFIILHCNSIYPTPFEKVHLGLMNDYRNEFNCITGFSDHTDGITIPIAAVALGAKVIEKHFALDRNLPVPDAPFSLEPIDFKNMVTAIRATENALIESDRSEIEPEENNFKNNIKVRLVLKGEKNAGEILQESDFDFKRADTGIDCHELVKVIGKKISITKAKGSVIQYADIQS